LRFGAQLGGHWRDGGQRLLARHRRWHVDLVADADLAFGILHARSLDRDAVFPRLRFDRTTAFFASVPGGLGEMALLGSQFGADLRRRVLVHSVRIIVVVTVIPFILRLALGHNLLPAAALAHASAGPSPVDWVILGACALRL
jgi:uncharacterized membrane protein AbrB (regulator of aidB expression)